MKRFIKKFVSDFLRSIGSDYMSKIMLFVIVIMIFIIIGSFDGYDNNGNLIEGTHCPIGIPISVIIGAIIAIVLRAPEDSVKL